MLVPAPDFAGYRRLAFNLVRPSARSNHAALRRLLRGSALAGEEAYPPERKTEIEAQHCQECAEACRRCEEACRQGLAVAA